MENKILFRCSQLGQLMTEPRSKSETLSETTKTYLTEVFINKKWGRKRDITNKYIQKGLLVEEDGITLYSRVTKELFLKNEENLRNEWISGTPDIFKGESVYSATEVVDIKSPWDIFTFYKAKTQPISKDYYWQLQGYMFLTGARKAKLAYCLINTPDVLISDQKRKFMWNAGIMDENPITEEVFEEIERNCLFDDMPLSERVHVIEVDYNLEDVTRLLIRIEECRAYIQNTFNYPLVEVLAQ